MNLLTTLTQAADEEQLKLHPLPKHGLAQQDEHLRQHYALLLAAVLTSQAEISEAQTRLLRLLLEALDLGDIRATLFEQARALTPEALLEAARAIREADAAEHLMLDLFVLLRLEAPLSEEQTRVLSELAAFLDLDAPTLSFRAEEAAAILGLNLAGTARTEQDGPGNTSAELPWQDLWPAYLARPLTAEALQQGLQGGLWVLDQPLTVHFPWQAQGAILLFRQGSTLETLAKEGSVTLKDCRLWNAVMHFNGASEVRLENCDWQGQYDLHSPNLAAISTQGVNLAVQQCRFSTPNMRAILVEEAGLEVSHSEFIACGREGYDGGAINHSNHTRNITHSRFERCIAAKGGAIYVEKLYGIHSCEFIACESRSLKDGGDIAVYAIENNTTPVMQDCVFRNTSLNVGDSSDGQGRIITQNCQFFNGNLYYYRRNFYNNHTFARSCIFENGIIIEKSL